MLVEAEKKTGLREKLLKVMRMTAYLLILKPTPHFHLDLTFLQFEQRSLTKTIQDIAFCFYYRCVKCMACLVAQKYDYAFFFSEVFTKSLLTPSI